MVCIYCGSLTAVKNSRLKRHNNHIWRRRACLSCASIFTTEESPQLSGMLMVKSRRTGSLKPFSRDQLFLTIYESCKHRPTAIADAANLTQTVITGLVAKHADGLAHAATIANKAHAVLQRFDPLAANLYAAYHEVGTEDQSTS